MKKPSLKIESIIGIILLALVGIGLITLFATTPTEKKEEGMQCEPGSGTCPPDMPVTKDSQKTGVPYVEITNPSGFVNTDPITIKQFIGKKVILLDFLTYSCINCQRTFPYLNAWYKKYEDQGLLIIGIHTPEFAFEKNIDNVRAAMKKFDITYPVVLDNDYGTWRAYGNQYWPRKYLIDIHGNIVYDHIGEGGYDETEQKIRELLDERAQVLGEKATMDSTLAADAVTPVSIAAQSPETYFGSARNQYLGNGTKGTSGIQEFTKPETMRLNTLYLTGSWDIQNEYAKNTKANASISYRFDAKNVYFVAGAQAPVDITITVDEKLIGTKTIRANTLYTLVSDASSGEHTLTIDINNPGLEAYTFTFG